METLCWFCNKAVCGCSWSKKFEPVPGWDAIKTKVHITAKVDMDSYEVRSCPLFDLTKESEREYAFWRKKLERTRHGHE